MFVNKCNTNLQKISFLQLSWNQLETLRKTLTKQTDKYI